jgi:hypothetical protein
MIDTQAGCSWGHRHAPPAGGHHNGDGGELRHGLGMRAWGAHARMHCAWREIAGGHGGGLLAGRQGRLLAGYEAMRPATWQLRLATWL